MPFIFFFLSILGVIKFLNFNFQEFSLIYGLLVQAKRKPLSFQCPLFNNQLLWSPSPLFGNDEQMVIGEHDRSQENWDKLIESCQPIEKFLEFRSSSSQVDMVTSSLVTTDVSASGLETSEKFIEADVFDFSFLDQFVVPLNLMERWGSAMGIFTLLFIFY